MSQAVDALALRLWCEHSLHPHPVADFRSSVIAPRFAELERCAPYVEDKGCACLCQQLPEWLEIDVAGGMIKRRSVRHPNRFHS